MFADNPFLQLTFPRVARALGDLKGCLWQEVPELGVSFSGASEKIFDFQTACGLSYKEIELPFCWGRLFEQGWFRLELPELPATDSGPLYLFWDDQGEGTAYVDGVPYYGFDVAHRHCPLPPGTREVYVEGLCLQSAIWHPAATGLDPRGSQLRRAALMRRDDLAWETYHDLLVLYDLALEETKANQPLMPPVVLGQGYHPPLDEVSVLCRRLFRALDDAVNALDQGGLPLARSVLQATYDALSGQHERIRAVLAGNAHIDLVWLWPERSGEYKAVHTFATMNRLMDTYPEFVFGYSQTASYEAVSRHSPALMEAVRARIDAGSWETLGATEVESDTLLACGEALARSFLLGQRGFERLQGKPSRVLWLPDVFGYCGCLPQIMRQSGVDFFFTTKLTWSNINLFPYSSFLWRGTDGTDVLVHVTQGNGYNQTASPEELRRGARAYRQSDVHDEFLAPTGYGDGGGGVTEEMCERARRYRSLAGMPETVWGRVDNFFERLDAVRARLPVYQGELYLEYHRGALTTHGDLKEAFRAGERALQTWEAVRCATGGTEIDEQSWKRLVFAQFHDYITGTSIPEVYEECVPELRAIAAHALESAARELGKDGTGAPALFNPLPVERIALVRDRDGHPMKAVRLNPLSGAPLDALPALKETAPVRAEAMRMESGQVSAEFDEQGHISRLSFGGQGIALRAALGELVLYPDVPHGFDAWEIDRQTLSMGRPVEGPAETVAVQGGAWEGEIAFRRKLGASSTVLIRYRLDAFQPVLHVAYEIDWHEEQTLLKVCFSTAYAGRQARFGEPFGSVLRGQQAGSPQDEARFEGPGSRWAVVADDAGDGLGVVTEAKYGWNCRDGTLGLSLLRAARVTGSESGMGRLFPPSIRSPRRDGKSRDEYSDQGQHVIRMALCLHGAEGPAVRNAAALADTLFTPALAYLATPGAGAISTGFEGLEGSSTLVPCWGKPAADGSGWILRLHETMGCRGRARLRLREGYQARRTDLFESRIDNSPITELTFTPYELISLRIFQLWPDTR